MKIKCVVCGENNLEKDIIGLNKKLFNKDITNYYCLECLAQYLECTVDDLYDKIEQFRDEGCTLFK